MLHDPHLARPARLSPAARPSPVRPSPVQPSRAAAAGAVEWPTLALTGGCYAVWALSVSAPLSLWLAVPLLAATLALHSSLCHETAHGHPLPSRAASEALMFPALGLFVPYERFRDTHLAHHRDERLTDPYDDPESNYLDPAVWARLSRPARALLRFNNTLFGRMLVGPAVGLARFWAEDARLLLRGDRAAARAWALHALGLAPVIGFLTAFGSTPPWAYLLAAYLANSALRIRTFLEHRAHEKAAGRSVIIEDRGPLAFLFLNNNLHAVHHAHPRAPWYALPALYAARRDLYLARNRSYRYASYAEIFRAHLFRAKDPVPHPLREEPRAR